MVREHPRSCQSLAEFRLIRVEQGGKQPRTDSECWLFDLCERDASLDHLDRFIAVGEVLVTFTGIGKDSAIADDDESPPPFTGGVRVNRDLHALPPSCLRKG